MWYMRLPADACGSGLAIAVARDRLVVSRVTQDKAEDGDVFHVVTEFSPEGTFGFLYFPEELLDGFETAPEALGKFPEENRPEVVGSFEDALRDALLGALVRTKTVSLRERALAEGIEIDDMDTDWLRRVSRLVAGNGFVSITAELEKAKPSA